MNTVASLVAAALLALVSQPTQPSTPAKTPPAQPLEKPAALEREVKFTFDQGDTFTLGQVPTYWKAEGTNQKGPVATWEVVADETAPSKPNVLALSKTNHDSGGTFNLCWTAKVRFTDGSIEVKFKAVSGKEDQGGGLIWRVKDKDNYMIARMNPLEDNFRVYYVKDGSRKQIETAKVSVQAGTWHTMRIEQHGDHVVCFLDGKEYLNAKDDHIQSEGGIGLWTKADAVTSFDDLTVKPGGADAGAAPKSPDGKGKKDKDDDDDDAAAKGGRGKGGGK
jgi:hypothetical protein